MPLGGEASFTPSGYIHIHNNQLNVFVGVTFPFYPTNYFTVLNKRRGANKRRGVKNDGNLINVGVQINVGG